MNLTHGTKNLLLAALLGLLAFGVYANSFSNQMFWDDDDLILKNTYVHNFELKNIFTHNVIAGAQLGSNYYRPILSTVFAAEWQAWQTSVAGWHVVNTLFHAADGILLFCILLAVFRKRSLAFLTALIFIIHPLQTEAVTYVNSMGDSLSVFFMFSGILLFLKFRESSVQWFRSWPFWLSLLAYPLALLSKETTIVMPALILLADFFRNNENSLLFRLKKAAKFVWPFFALAIFYVILRATVLNFGNSFNLYGEQNYYTSHIFVRIFTFLKALTVYFGLIFWPVHQHMERNLAIASTLLNAQVLLGAVIFLILLFAAFFLVKRLPGASFGALWFLIAISPMSNIAVPINGLIYEHWLYVPLIGIALAIISIVLMLIEKMRTPNRREIAKVSAAGLFSIAAIGLSGKTMIRNRDWHDPITFYNQVLQYAPDSYRIVNNLGMAYDDDHQIIKAQELYERAIALDPSNPVAYHNLANSYKDAGQYNLAEQNFKKALSLDHNFVFSLNALVNLYLAENRIQEAQNLAAQYGYQLNLPGTSK